jgi:hypothetical protein
VIAVASKRAAGVETLRTRRVLVLGAMPKRRKDSAI